MDFTLARYVRIRLQGMHTTKNAGNNIQWLVDHTELNKRSFYSLKFIKIGARLECNGHARDAKQYNGDEVSGFSNGISIFVGRGKQRVRLMQRLISYFIQDDYQDDLFR